MKLWFSAKNVPDPRMHPDKPTLCWAVNCSLLYLCKVIHHIVSADVHKLARELLDPEPELQKSFCIGFRACVSCSRVGGERGQQADG